MSSCSSTALLTAQYPQVLSAGENIILYKCSFLRNITVMYSNVPVAHNTHVNHRRPEDTHVSSSIPQMGRHIPPSNSHLMKA